MTQKTKDSPSQRRDVLSILLGYPLVYRTSAQHRINQLREAGHLTTERIPKLEPGPQHLTLQGQLLAHRALAEQHPSQEVRRAAALEVQRYQRALLEEQDRLPLEAGQGAR